MNIELRPYLIKEGAGVFSVSDQEVAEHFDPERPETFAAHLNGRVFGLTSYEVRRTYNEDGVTKFAKPIVEASFPIKPAPSNRIFPSKYSGPRFG